LFSREQLPFNKTSKNENTKRENIYLSIEPIDLDLFMKTIKYMGE
jgi:hypothetical protein